jgi:hypothetical protein
MENFLLGMMAGIDILDHALDALLRWPVLASMIALCIVARSRVTE